MKNVVILACDGLTYNMVEDSEHYTSSDAVRKTTERSERLV